MRVATTCPGEGSAAWSGAFARDGESSPCWMLGATAMLLGETSCAGREICEKAVYVAISSGTPPPTPPLSSTPSRQAVLLSWTATMAMKEEEEEEEEFRQPSGESYPT